MSRLLCRSVITRESSSIYAGAFRYPLWRDLPFALNCLASAFLPWLWRELGREAAAALIALAVVIGVVTFFYRCCLPFLVNH
jgi:hypothetical protein